MVSSELSMDFLLRSCGIIVVAFSPLLVREFPRLAFFYHFLTVFTVLTTACIKLVLVLLYSVDSPPNSLFFVGAKLMLLVVIASGLALAAGAFMDLLMDLFFLDLRGSGPGSHPRFRRHLWKIALWARSKSTLEKTLHTVVLKLAPVSLVLLPLVPISVYERHDCHTCWLDVEECAGRRPGDDEHTGINSRMFVCEGAYKASLITLIQLAIIVIVFLRYVYNASDLSKKSKKPGESPASPEQPLLRSSSMAPSFVDYLAAYGTSSSISSGSGSSNAASAAASGPEADSPPRRRGGSASVVGTTSGVQQEAANGAHGGGDSERSTPRTARRTLEESCGGADTIELHGSGSGSGSWLTAGSGSSNGGGGADYPLRESLTSDSVDFGELLDETRRYELGYYGGSHGSLENHVHADGSLSPDALLLRRRQFSLGEQLSHLDRPSPETSPTATPREVQRRPSILVRAGSSSAGSSPPGGAASAPMSVSFADSSPRSSDGPENTAHGPSLHNAAASPHPAIKPAQPSLPGQLQVINSSDAAPSGSVLSTNGFVVPPPPSRRTQSAAELVSSLSRRRSRWKTFADEYDAAWIEAIGLDANWEFIVSETKFYATILSLLCLGVSVIQNGVLYGFSNYLVISSGQLLNYTVFWLIVYFCYFLNEARYTLQHEVPATLRPTIMWISAGVTLLAYWSYSMSLVLAALTLVCFMGVVSTSYDWLLYPLMLRTALFKGRRPRLPRSPSWYGLSIKNSANAALLKGIHIWFRVLIGSIIAIAVVLFFLSRLIATDQLPDMFTVSKRPLEPPGSGFEVTVGFLDLVSRDPLSSASFYVRNTSSAVGPRSDSMTVPADIDECADATSETPTTAATAAAAAAGEDPLLGATEVVVDDDPLDDDVPDQFLRPPQHQQPQPDASLRSATPPAASAAAAAAAASGGTACRRRSTVQRPLIPDPAATFGPCAFSSHDGLTLIDFGLFAQLAYFRQNSAGFNEFLETFLDGFVVVNSSQHIFRATAPDSVSFFDLYNEKLNLSIVTIPGTHLLSPLDILQDIDIWLEAGTFQLFSQVLTGLRFWPRDVQAYLIRIISLLDQLLPYGDSRHYFQPIVEYVRQIKQHRNVVVVGHSLGGGLASIVGSKAEVRSISFSGPGIVETRKKLQIPLKNINKYTVNVIPENDMVPGIGVQGGIIYHTSCFRNGLDHCHMIQNTVCELIRKCGGDRSALMNAKRLELSCDFLPEPNHAIGLRFRDVYAVIVTAVCLLTSVWYMRGDRFRGLWQSIKPETSPLWRVSESFRASLVQSFVPGS